MNPKNKPLGHSDDHYHSFATTLSQKARMQQLLDMGLFLSRSELVRFAIASFQSEDQYFNEDISEGVSSKTITFKMGTFWAALLKSEPDKSLVIRRAVNKLLAWFAPLIPAPLPAVAPPRYERCCWE